MKTVTFLVAAILIMAPFQVAEAKTLTRAQVVNLQKILKNCRGIQCDMVPLLYKEKGKSI